MTTDLLTVSHLNKHYEDFHLADVSFHLPAGYIMGFIGPNGAGKTTLARCLCGLERKMRGTFAFTGKEYKPKHILLPLCNRLVVKQVLWANIAGDGVAA